MPSKCICESVGCVVDFEYLDGLVGGAGCKAAAVVVGNSIMLGRTTFNAVEYIAILRNAYYHILVTMVIDRLGL